MYRSLIGVLLLLASCQLPVGAPVSSKGATLNITLPDNGFVYLGPSSGRVVATPQAVPGRIWVQLTDPANVKTPILGFVEALGAIPLGVWNLQVKAYDAGGSVVLGTGTLSNVTLHDGLNQLAVTVVPSQVGQGTIDVTYSWTVPSDLGTFTLKRLTLTGTAPVYSVSETSVDITGASKLWDHTSATKTVRFIMNNLPSGSYRLEMQLQYSNQNHPPVNATAEVFDNITSVANEFLSDDTLNGAPAIPTGVSMTYGSGVPTIGWSSLPTTATGYKIYRDGVEIDSVAASVYGYADYAYVPGGLYTYSVVAKNGFGESLPVTAGTPFQSVTSVDIPDAYTAVGLGQNDNVPVTISPATPSVTGVTWSSSEPQRAFIDPATGFYKSLSYGKTTITATSNEYASKNDSVDLLMDASVSTLAGQAALSGSVDGTGTSARFIAPKVLARAPDGTLSTIENGQSVRKITPAGVVTTVAFSTALPGSNVTGLADDGSNLYATLGHAIYKITGNTWSLLAGDFATSGNVGGTYSTARFSSPEGLVAVGAYLYVCDTGNHTIRQVATSGGSTSTFSGSTVGLNDGVWSSAQFDSPRGIAYDGSETLYVTDAGNLAFRAVSLNAGTLGKVTTVAAGAPGWADGDLGTAEFGPLSSIAVDGNSLYFADGNATLRVLRLPSPASAGSPATLPIRIETIAGQAGSPAFADGSGKASRLGTSIALAAGGGVVYFADASVHVIRQAVVNAYSSIQWNDPAFASTLPYNQSGPHLYAGNGATGNIREGTIVLYTTTNSNHGKLIVTGIDFDYGGTGIWRMHLDWTTWTSVGTLFSQGTNLVYVASLDSSQTLDMDTGNVVTQSADSDLSLWNTDSEVNRRFNPASNFVTAGIYTGF